MYKENFAKRLNELIKENNVSIYQLSKVLKISHTTILRYLKCEREISLEYLCLFADYFEVSLDFLAGRINY